MNTDFKPKAAIFDMDGLMLDTERPMVTGWIDAGKIIGWDITKDLAIDTIGLNGEDIRNLCMSRLGPDFPYAQFDVVLHRLFEEEFAKGIAHKPGLIKILDHLADNKIPMAVATSTYKKSAYNKLAIAGITDYFKVVACGDEVPKGKPAPDVFLLAAQRLGVPAADCVGFEDSAAGLQALAGAGIHSVFVKDLIEPPADVLSTVWKRLDDLGEAVSLF
ncbi:MAG: HAD family phosphatase [Treponema sp.]|nr:HAD family phosphatase [Treponema sp.]